MTSRKLAFYPVNAGVLITVTQNIRNILVIQYGYNTSEHHHMEHQKITLMCLLDLSTAFDTVDHSVLLEILNKRYGMGGMVNDWFATYLSQRFCKISIQDAYSTPRELTFSVPQGSIAGPSLYTYYASTLQDVIPSDIDIYAYADDHGIKKSYQANDKLGEVYVKADLSQCMNDVNGWMDSNRSKLNNSKTELAAFASRHHMEKVSDDGIDINNSIIERSPCVKYLGVHLDSVLSMKEHITNKCRIAMINIIRLFNIRRFLT